MRGVVELPIEHGSHFGYGIWVEVGEADCLRLVETWHEPIDGESFHGRLANELATYPGSLGLRVTLETREQLPAVHIDDEHLLAVEQKDGISEARADELAASGHH